MILIGLCKFQFLAGQNPDPTFHLYLLVGQSNMAGRGAVDSLSTPDNPLIMMLNEKNEWVIARDPVHFDKPDVCGVGPGLAFAQTMLAYQKDKTVKIGLIPCAVGGTNIDEWQPGMDAYNGKYYPYDDALKRLHVAMQYGVVKGIIWHQGESDSQETKASLYSDKLQTLVNHFRNEIGNQQVPFVAGELGFYKEEYQLINRELKKLTDMVPISAVASSEGLLHKGDGTHFDSQSARKLGVRMAEKMHGLQQQYASKANRNDFSVKGFHLDLRAEVMTMPALKAFASELAQFGINTLVMEWEATFPYNENAIISNRNSYKPGEVRDFIAHCTSLGIDVIPIHHCFGHAEWILRHERYRHICEDSKEISQVCPMKVEEAIPIFRSLFKEMADYHPSPYFHIGGDETYLLGSCPLCREKVEKEGKSKLFVDYVKAMCDIVTEMGKIPVLWADIILKYPEAIAEMPKNAIYVDWNYGWQINRFGDMNKLYKAGATMWGAPSIRSNPDNMYLTNWLTHFNNQRDFIPYSREAGYEGIIMTSWSTSGQYSLLYEPRWEVQDIEPIRNVYPLNGFRILLAAYAKSLQQVEPLDPSSFVKEYAVARFGLTEEEGQVFWQVLSEKQELVKLWKNTNGLPATQLLQQATSQRDRLYAMRPRKNRTEFEHFKLMFDIRVSYLKGKELEADYQSENYNRSQAKDLLKRVEAIIQEEKKLDKRFTALQKGFLTDSEINHLNTIRKHKLYLLKDFLAQQARD